MNLEATISPESKRKIQMLREFWPDLVAHCTSAAAIDDDGPYNFDRAVFHFENFSEFDVARDLRRAAKDAPRNRYRDLVTRPEYRDAWATVQEIESEVSKVLTARNFNASHILSESTKTHGWHFSAVSVGSRARQTAAAEAAAEFMRRHGFSAGVHYRLD